jgi:hypothetical protein
MIYTVSNDEYEIEKLLLQLREIYGDYAFVSYIDGEYGIRTLVYNSLVNNFFNSIKKENTICIGIIFKGNKVFLEKLCDHVIEINDVEFLSTISNNVEDNSHSSDNHVNSLVPSNSYSGNDGWDLCYIRGLHSKKYEDILLKMNYKNIFYTLHVDGSNFINKFGKNNISIYRINNEDIFINNLNNYSFLKNLNFIEKNPRDTIKRNKITVWIRNTNKWPGRNLPQMYYNSLFDYCIKNNKICNVFQDLIPVELPNHPNIIDCTVRIKNRPDLDNFINVCDDSDIFIGADSGPMLLVMHSSIDIIAICFGYPFMYPNIHNPKMLFNVNNVKLLVKSLDNFYSAL